MLWATKATVKSKFWKQQIIKSAKDASSSLKSSRMGGTENSLQGNAIICIVMTCEPTSICSRHAQRYHEQQ